MGKDLDWRKVEAYNTSYVGVPKSKTFLRVWRDVYGDDYPTEDGTCIRDYIHVDDLADAHIAALARLRPGKKIALNLGTGRGASVLEIVETCRRVTGHPIPIVMGERRPGDPPSLVADPSQANRALDWNPQHTTIESIVRSAWKWHAAHPNGYDE